MKKKKENRHYSFVLLLFVIAVTGYFAISLIKLQIDINDREIALAAAKAAYEEQLASNEEIKALFTSEDKTAFIERAAREAGYCYKDEKTYQDISSSND